MEGQSTRQQKVSRELQRYLAELLRSKGMAYFGGAMVTVSEVRISPDLSIAKVYVSVFPSNRQEEVMKQLEDEKKTLARRVGPSGSQTVKNSSGFGLLPGHHS